MTGTELCRAAAVLGALVPSGRRDVLVARVRVAVRLEELGSDGPRRSRGRGRPPVTRRLNDQPRIAAPGGGHGGDDEIRRGGEGDQTGVASGMNANTRTMGGALGAAVMGSLVTGHTAPDGWPAEEGTLLVSRNPSAGGCCG
jgi:hypothetical protein